MSAKEKIYIVTLGAKYIFSNSGTFLQHWALRKVISELGYTPIRIPGIYDMSYFAINNKNWIKNFCTQISRIVLHYLMPNKTNDHSSNIHSIRDFKQAKLFKKCFTKNIGQIIEDNTAEAKCVILGGDQVFSTILAKSAISQNATKCISYAASLDWEAAQIDDNWKEEMAQILPGFSKIGLRESIGKSIVESLNFQTEKVADPVMLMTPKDLDLLAGKSKVFKEKTLFSYLLNIKSNEKFHLEDQRLLAKELGVGLKIHGIQGTQYIIPNKHYVYLDPSKFVKAIIDSEYVVTNSYHGTVLALMFHKPFVSLKQNNQNSRQQELLEWLGLEDNRISMDDLKTKGKDLLNKKIDWNLIDKKFDLFRKQSLNWLQNAIE